MARKKANDTSKKSSTTKKKAGRPRKEVVETLEPSKINNEEEVVNILSEEEIDENEDATLDADNDILMNEFDMANEVEGAPFDEPKDDCLDEEQQEAPTEEAEPQEDIVEETNHEENKRIKGIENLFGYSWNGQEIDW